MVCRNAFQISLKSRAFPLVGAQDSPLQPRVGLPPGSAVCLVAACPYRLRRWIRRQFALAHPPVHLTREDRSLFCQDAMLAPWGIERTQKPREFIRVLLKIHLGIRSKRRSRSFDYYPL